MILPPPEPELTFRVEPNEAVLSRPLSYASYTLESTTNLTPPAIWSPRAASLQATNGRLEQRSPRPGPPHRE